MKPKPKKDPTIEAARRVLKIEAEAVSNLRKNLDLRFKKAVDLLLFAKGKVVLTGMGKSGIICQKIASTLASTGTSAFFLHPAEGVHGDMGVLTKNDVLIALSNSGETEELIKMLPAVKRLGVKVLAMTGRRNSTLSRYADVTIDIGVKKEACPLGLAPTASTTAALAMGDAMAVVLLKRRGFRKEDFALLHPAGHLGGKLLTVKELMHTGRDIPRVAPSTKIKDVIRQMSAPRSPVAGVEPAAKRRVGITGVFVRGRKGVKLVGVITDGDLRRALLKVYTGVYTRRFARMEKAKDIMTKDPKVISEDALAEAALKKMEDHSIDTLFVHRKGRRADIAGIVYLKDLIKAGVI
ncbi:MAG: KpsF/GutQ family sugar-phosphate isomerase [Deltaproteobacteria bacterium]|nr:KpsF/GutQ family sugar-phosphate isomerase [Deltaproteobacteria bacterium]